MSKLFICLFLLLGLYNCQNYGDAQVYDMIMNEEEDSTSMKINAHKGKEFVLKFKGNPTLGYNWVLTNPEVVNGPILGLNFGLEGKGDYVPEVTGLLGSGGSFYFHFKATKVSSLARVLKFSYRRNWEDQEKKVHEFKVLVTVS